MSTADAAGALPAGWKTFQQAGRSVYFHPGAAPTYARPTAPVPGHVKPPSAGEVVAQAAAAQQRQEEAEDANDVTEKAGAVDTYADCTRRRRRVVLSGAVGAFAWGLCSS